MVPHVRDESLLLFSLSLSLWPPDAWSLAQIQSQKEHRGKGKLKPQLFWP